jgi:hypothetical protein
MKTSALYAASAYAGLTAATVQLPFYHLSLNSAQQRFGKVTNFWLGAFAVNITVGTPPQNMTVALSTNTAPSWVVDTEKCDGRGNDYDGYRNCSHGSYSSSMSSSMVVGGNQSFSSWYQDDASPAFPKYRSSANGDRIRETASIGGVGISDLALGLARDTNHWMGVLGLGFNETDRLVRPTPQQTVLDHMVEQGVINSPAISLWLDSPDAISGQLLLGAIDSTKFQGPLVRIEANRYLSGFNDLGVILFALNGTQSSSSREKPLMQIPDALFITVSPSDPLTNLPLDTAKPIWTLAGATYNETYARALIPCAAASTATGSITLELGEGGGVKLPIPIRDLILPQDEWTDLPQGSASATDMGDAWCMFGIQSINRERTYHLGGRNDPYWTIGSTVLKRTYIVLDLANEEVAFAPLRTVSNEAANIIPFPAYGAKVPQSTHAGRQYCWSYNTEFCSSVVVVPTPGREGISREAIIGIAVGSSILGIALIALPVWMLFERKRKMVVQKDTDSLHQEEGLPSRKQAPGFAAVPKPLPPTPAFLKAPQARDGQGSS